jgi:hypothetical protein
VRRVLRVAALVAVVVCLMLFFSIGSGGSAVNGRQSSWISIGQPWPWYENRMEQELRPDGGRSASGEAGVILKSPAWFLLVAAIVGLVAFRLTRPGSPEAAPA